MATPKGETNVRGRFRAGTTVKLYEVAGPEVLRSEGSELVGTYDVDDDGVLTVPTVVGKRYLAEAILDGSPTTVRITGRAKGDDGFFGQAPVGNVEAPAPRHVVDPKSEPLGTRLAQEQVPDDVPQRSATPHGTAHPMDADERGPYPSQDDDLYSSGKVQQRSDTPVGQATPIHDTVSDQTTVGIQEDGETASKVIEQRSDTPLGVATPLPQGDAIEAVKGIESAEVKAAVGEPSQAEAQGVSSVDPKGGHKAPAPKKQRTR